MKDDVELTEEDLDTDYDKKEGVYIFQDDYERKMIEQRMIDALSRNLSSNIEDEKEENKEDDNRGMFDKISWIFTLFKLVRVAVNLLRVLR